MLAEKLVLPVAEALTTGIPGARARFPNGKWVVPMPKSEVDDSHFQSA